MNGVIIPSEADTVVLLRTTRVTPHDRDFADDLALGSAATVAYLIDGRHGLVFDEGRPVVALDDAAMRTLQLPLVDLYPWRCGDFGLYVARRQFPAARFFWLIEADVRFSMKPTTAFFAAMASSRADLLISGLRPAQPDWFWYPHGRGRNAAPYRCLYSAARLSTTLIDAMLEKRQAHGRSFLRRTLWPNDEAFTATTAANGRFVVQDINAVAGPWYSPDLFNYDVTIDGASLPGSRDRPELLHSVRFGDQLNARRTHPAIDRGRWRAAQRRFARAVLPFARW